MEWTDAAFWLAAWQIILINFVLSGDNAVVIALACRMLPPRQRFWGMAFGAGAAVLLRVFFTLIIATVMGLPYLKLVGGLLLLWIAVKLVVPSESHGEGSVQAGDNLWKAVQIVAIADVVMSLDNVIAIAAAAKGSWTLIIFGLVVSVPLIVAGSALLMSLMERFPILIWAGAALLGWVAGEIMIEDPAVIGWLGADTAHHLHAWAARVGAIFVTGLGLLLVRRRRPLAGEEKLAGLAVAAWVVGDIVVAAMVAPGLWGYVARACVLAIITTAYIIIRGRRPPEARPGVIEEAPEIVAEVQDVVEPEKDHHAGHRH